MPAFPTHEVRDMSNPSRRIAALLSAAAALSLSSLLTVTVARAADTPPDGFYRYPSIAKGTVVFASEATSGRFRRPAEWRCA